MAWCPNALDALDEAATANPRIEVATGENLAGTEVWVRLRDNGPGIDPGALGEVFSPFFTSKAAGNGLGLAISKRIAEELGGQLEVSAADAKETRFRLTLPPANKRTGKA